MLTLSLSRVSTCILCSWDFVAARCTASRTYVRHLSSVVVVVGVVVWAGGGGDGGGGGAGEAGGVIGCCACVGGYGGVRSLDHC